MPDSIGSYGLRESGGAVVALRDGLHLFDFDTGTVTFLAAPERRVQGTRFNDGKVSSDGRFFAGLRMRNGCNGPSALCFGSTQTVQCIAWTSLCPTARPGDRMATRCSTPIARAPIWAYDHDPTDGSLANRRVVARRPKRSGGPTARPPTSRASIGAVGFRLAC